MIVGCPACLRTYRLDDARFRPGARMRCTRCGHLFAPNEDAGPSPAAASGPDPEAAGEAGAPPAAPYGAPAAAPVAGSAAAPPAIPADAPIALLADAGRRFRERVRPILESLGCHVLLAEDGTDAFKMAVSRKPAMMVVSVHLAGLSGVAICEGVKGSPHLKGIRVALVGSELSSDLFNQDTALAYGADLFLDERMSGADLRSGLGGLLSTFRGDGDVDLDDPFAALADGEAADRGPEWEIARLARIMLSDLRLYNPDRFVDAVRQGSLLETFKDELARGRDLIDRRFPGCAARQDLLRTALTEGAEREIASDLDPASARGQG